MLVMFGYSFVATVSLCVLATVVRGRVVVSVREQMLASSRAATISTQVVSFLSDKTFVRMMTALILLN
jgi:hypothetical protein